MGDMCATYIFISGGVPFVYGPIGGGERIPQCIDIKMSKRDTFVEWSRNAIADISIHMYVNKKAYKKASLILSTTPFLILAITGTPNPELLIVDVLIFVNILESLTD